MNGHTMAGDEHRRHLVDLHALLGRVLAATPPNKEPEDQASAPQRETTTDTSAPSREQG